MKTETDYIRLPEVVTDLNGVGIPQLTATLVKRTDNKAMYRRWDNVWEVFRIKIQEESLIMDRLYPKREVYPGNEMFGVTAWCYHNEANANRMYDEMPDCLVGQQ